MSKDRVIRKKGDLTGAGKGDWYRVNLQDEQYKNNYDKIFGKKDLLVEKKLISKDESSK
jgi:hypothetical protein